MKKTGFVGWRGMVGFRFDGANESRARFPRY